MAEEKLQKYKASLEELAKQIGPLFNRKAIGIDIGIDENFFPWIIEVNMKPDPYVFNQLNRQGICLIKLLNTVDIGRKKRLIPLR